MICSHRPNRPFSLSLHFNHADNLGLIGAGKIEVGDGDVDVGQAQDAHDLWFPEIGPMFQISRRLGWGELARTVEVPS
jgi:hypothetical protein